MEIPNPLKMLRLLPGKTRHFTTIIKKQMPNGTIRITIPKDVVVALSIKEHEELQITVAK
jgi:hypothetical protein